LCCLAAALLLPSGCRRASEPPAITFVVALLPAEQVQYMQVLGDFTARTGIRVNLVAQQYEQIRTVVEAEATAGRGRLDLVELDVFQLPLLQSAMQPLDPLINVAAAADQPPPDAWLAGRLGVPPKLLYVPHRLNWQPCSTTLKRSPNPRLTGTPSWPLRVPTRVESA
jgi:ABC-type glycerol-3-phosphate transport system substrate-binding protein